MSDKTDSNNTKTIIKKSDIILIAAILIVAILLFIIYRVNQKTGLSVNIYTSGELVETLSLDKNREYEVDTEYGYNKVIIEDGSAYVVSADCPDKICVSHSPISKTGETIICLPHKLVVEVK